MALGKEVRTYYEGAWHEGNLAILGAADFAMWLGNQVFDGARSFEGTAPDLALHCARIVRSAEAMGMVSPVTGEEVLEIAWEGIKKYPKEVPLYIRPMMWSKESGPVMLECDPESTGFALCIEDCPMPEPHEAALTLSPFRRPSIETALTGAKAASLYPNNSRIFTEARKRGFDNGLTRDLNGNVCETASSNIFMAKGGVVFTPVPNGTFLNGLTRQRVIQLLRADGVDVVETTLRPADFETADEVFYTANASKVMPFTRYEAREIGIGPLFERARTLYWDYAHQEARY
ncbi:branched-chain amino acid aminotransferase [Paracoccaceae bacterium GXU_MW_L88]